MALDAHTCEEAISVDLPPPGDRLRAQFLIHEWHSQAAVHALRQPPRILILRFARYTDGPSGAAKNHALVTWTRVLQMPMFTGDGMESANCAYSVEAAILHSGLSITTGHYTTLLIEADTILFCDDNIAPRRLTPGSPFHTAGFRFQGGLHAHMQARGGALMRAKAHLLHDEVPVLSFTWSGDHCRGAGRPAAGRLALQIQWSSKYSSCASLLPALCLPA